MKMILTLALVLFTHASFAAENTATPNQVQSLMLSNSEIQLDNGAFWIREWAMNQPRGINLKTVTNYDSGLLMTFSGADYTYLNRKAADQFKSIGNNTYQWVVEDQNLTYKRTYEVQGDSVMVNVSVQFKAKAPEKAYLNIVSRGGKDDAESRDRELFYYTNGKIERNLVNKDISSTEVLTQAKWVGAGSRYFIFTVLPETAPEKVLLQSTGEKSAQASLQYPILNNQLNARFKVVFAPKQLDVLRKIDPALDTTLDLGMFAIIGYPILWSLKFIFKFVHNYGWAIVILTILIKLLTFPLVLKSTKSMRKMAEFQPKMNALKAKYGNDKEGFNREMMVLMKTSGYNPMAGCFPMLLQMPIFFALYRVLYSSVELYQAPFILWLTDLSSKDPLFITPILMTVVMFLQQRLTPAAPGMDPAQRKMMMFMPLMFGAFMVTTASGLCIYMLVNATISVIQQQYLNKKLGVPGNAAGMATGF